MGSIDVMSYSLTTQEQMGHFSLPSRGMEPSRDAVHGEGGARLFLKAGWWVWQEFILLFIIP